MAEIKFNTGWLTAIGLTAKCGTPEEVMSLCVAIQRASLGEEVGELSPLVELLFNPIAEEIEAKHELSRVRSEARKGNKTATKSDKTSTKTSKNEQEKEEEREEDGEAERENDKEEIPHTPLEEKDKEKGEEGEEEKEEEREVSCSLALPAPLYIGETDPKKMTDKTLEAEFDALWMRYPRKVGKKDALRHYKAARKERVAYEAIDIGLNKYIEYCRGKPEEYIMQGSTWFCGHHWEDDRRPQKARAGSMEWLASIANGGESG